MRGGGWSAWWLIDVAATSDGHLGAWRAAGMVRLWFSTKNLRRARGMCGLGVRVNEVTGFRV